MTTPRCWWFGCEMHEQDPSPVEEARCMRCGDLMSYESLVGITRHMRTTEWCRYWLFRRWWPKKCHECGGRWKHDDRFDHIPF